MDELAITGAGEARRRTFLLLKDFTMIPEWIFCQNLALAELARDVPGCVVECGVWRGGMSAGLCTVLGRHRTYFLFDSFQGLPAAKEIDGPAALKWQADKTSPFYYDNCTAEPDWAKRAMEFVGATRYELNRLLQRLPAEVYPTRAHRPPAS